MPRLLFRHFKVVEMSKEVYVKVHVAGPEIIVAACDKELLGSIIKDPSRKIHLYVDPAFFGGELKDIDSFIKILSKASSANLVGKDVVEAAIRARLVHNDAVLNVNGVLIAFFARF